MLIWIAAIILPLLMLADIVNEALAPSYDPRNLDGEWGN